MFIFLLLARSISSKSAKSKFYIYDARRQIAAALNMAAGKGTEDPAQYEACELIHSNIENIHVMRQSFSQLGELLMPGGLAAAIQEDAGSSGGYYAKLEENGWMRHLRLILMAAVRVAERLHLDLSSVLVHCSDGW